MKHRQPRPHLWYLLVGVGAAMMLMAAACAPSAPATPPPLPKKEATPATAPTPSPAPKPKAAEEPQKGGILVFGNTGKPQSFDVIKADVAAYRATAGIYDYLAALDYRAGVDYRMEKKSVPGLATKWEQPNADTYIFTLRQGVKWHDGKPFTVDDVLFTIGEWQNKENADNYRIGRQIAKAEKLSDSQVKITLKEPSADFLAEVGDFSNHAMVVAKHVADRRTEIIGTGPFRMKSADLKTGVVVERNPDFWDTGKPYLDGVKTFVGMDASAMQSAFIAGEFDLLNFGNKAEFDAVQKAVPNIQSEPFLQDYGNSINFKQTEPPFNDVKVRKAVHLAIDRQALVQIVTFGLGVINPPGGLGLLSKAGWGIPYEELQKMPGYRQPKDQDIAEAKKLLAEAGYSDGFSFEVYYAKDRTTTPPIAEAVIPMLKKVGIEMKLKPTERGVYLDNFPKGTYQVVMDLSASWLPTTRLQAWFHSKGSQNFMGIKDAKLDALIEAQAREMDVEKRKKQLREIQEIIFENMHSVPTIDLASFAAWQPWLRDFPRNYGAQAHPPRWGDLWFDPKTAPKRSF